MNEDYPRVLMTRKMEKTRRSTSDLTRMLFRKGDNRAFKEVFPIKSCNKVFPRDIGKGRPCLNYHFINALAMPGDVNKEEYRN
jgi:excinuclease ABC subunit C